MYVKFIFSFVLTLLLGLRCRIIFKWFSSCHRMWRWNPLCLWPWSIKWSIWTTHPKETSFKLGTKLLVYLLCLPSYSLFTHMPILPFLICVDLVNFLQSLWFPLNYGKWWQDCLSLECPFQSYQSIHVATVSFFYSQGTYCLYARGMFRWWWWSRDHRVRGQDNSYLARKWWWPRGNTQCDECCALHRPYIVLLFSHFSTEDCSFRLHLFHLIHLLAV